jgi:hypothetical protein
MHSFFHILSLQVLLCLQTKLEEHQDEDDIVLSAHDIEDLGMAGDESVVIEIALMYFGKSIQVARPSYCSGCCSSTCCQQQQQPLRI